MKLFYYFANLFVYLSAILYFTFTLFNFPGLLGTTFKENNVGA